MVRIYHVILTLNVACLVFWDVHISTAQDTIEMPKLIYEETLPTALYPGNIVSIKLHLRPGIKWFRFNLQENSGDPTSVAIETAMAIRVTVDSMFGQIERDWYSAGTNQFASPEINVYGQLKFHENNAFIVNLLCMIDTYEVQVNGYQKFTFQHRSSVDLTSFNVLRIMAEVDSLEVCWIKFNLELLSSATTTSGSTPCHQEVQTSLCDELVCYLFSDEHLMYGSTPMPTPTSTHKLSGNVVSSLEDMTERICCLDGLTDDIATNGDRSSLQLAANITSELLTWNGNGSWDTINQLSDNGPISLLDRLDDVAQIIGSQLEVGEVVRANTSTLSCILESNTLEQLIKKDWTFKPFANSEEQITIKGSDLISTGLSKNKKLSILGVAYTNLTETFNNHQKGTKDHVIADVISATVFTPTGRFSIPASFKRQITNLAGNVNASTERVLFCGFWDDFHNDTEMVGGWSTAGCQRVDVVDEEFIEDNLGDFVSCYCSHTTNYAILMRIVPIRVRRRIKRKITTSKPTELIKLTTTLPTTKSRKPNIPTATVPEPTTKPITKPTTTTKPTTKPTTKLTIKPTRKPTTKPKSTTTSSLTTKPNSNSNTFEAIQTITETFTKQVSSSISVEPEDHDSILQSPEPHLVTKVTFINSKPTREYNTLPLVKDTTSAKSEALASKPHETVSSSTAFNPTNRVTQDDVVSTNQSATSNNVSAINDSITDYYYYYYYYYPVDTVSESILDVLSLIGCIMSIIALTVALICFIAFRHSSLDTERIIVHMNLMGSLLVAMTVFLISSLLTSFLIPCKIIAVLLHYLYLAVFSWMLVEGIHLYRLIVTVYGSEKQMAMFYFLLGWGLPLLIVGTSSFATEWKGYGIPNVTCWLNTENGFIWAFAAPGCVIMLVNFLVLCMVIKTTVTASKVCSQDKMTQVKTGLRSSLVLLPMLGISWGIGLITHIHVVFEYIFVLMNSFQGVWLVAVCCLMNGEVRNAFKSGIRKTMGRYSGSVSTTSTSTSSTSNNSCNFSKDGGSILTEVG